MTAPSYMNLMRAQQRPLHSPVKIESGLSLAEITARTKKARAALGIPQNHRITAVARAPEAESAKAASVVAPITVEPPTVIVVTHERVEDADRLIPAMSWKAIIRQVSEKHKVPLADIMSARRNKYIVAARYEAMYRLRYETTMSYPEIGRRVGGRDHTTVLYGVRKHELLLAGKNGSRSAFKCRASFDEAMSL